MLTACNRLWQGFGSGSGSGSACFCPIRKKKMRIRAKRKRKGMNKSNFVEKEMCNANNFVSSVQTSGIRVRITGYSFRKTLETKKKYAGIILHQGKKATHVFFVLINRFRQFGAEKIFINSFSKFF